MLTVSVGQDSMGPCKVSQLSCKRRVQLRRSWAQQDMLTVSVQPEPQGICMTATMIIRVEPQQTFVPVGYGSARGCRQCPACIGRASGLRSSRKVDCSKIATSVLCIQKGQQHAMQNLPCSVFWCEDLRTPAKQTRCICSLSINHVYCTEDLFIVVCLNAGTSQEAVGQTGRPCKTGNTARILAADNTLSGCNLQHHWCRLQLRA